MLSYSAEGYTFVFLSEKWLHKIFNIFDIRGYCTCRSCIECALGKLIHRRIEKRDKTVYIGNSPLRRLYIGFGMKELIIGQYRKEIFKSTIFDKNLMRVIYDFL